MKTILQSKELVKLFAVDKQHSTTVLNNVSLNIRQGEFVALMGPSGSGKSTLLYNISGMDQPSSGSVIFNGKDIVKLSDKQKSEIRLNEIGFVFQQINLLKNLNIFDNIVLTGYLSRRSSRVNVDKRAMHLMRQMGIAKLSNRDITQASGGQLQRVGICRALINKPSILLGDEPTGALNSKAAEDVMQILTRINQQGTTMLLATHDIRVAAKTDRVMYMLDGSISGKYVFGKPERRGADFKEREKKLTDWLLTMGF